jgi:preprotein translocase subunit SecD
MEEQGTLSPETGKKVIIIGTVECTIGLALVVLLLAVLRRPADLTTIAIIIFPALPSGAGIVYLIMKDRKKERPA